MKSNIVSIYSAATQNCLNEIFCQFAEIHPISGRLLAFPVALIDVTMETLKIPLRAIEMIALAAINLFGAAFSNLFTVKDMLFSLEQSAYHFTVTPIALAFMPVKLLYQTIALTINPSDTLSIQHTHPSKPLKDFPRLYVTAHTHTDIRDGSFVPPKPVVQGPPAK